MWLVLTHQTWSCNHIFINNTLLNFRLTSIYNICNTASEQTAKINKFVFLAFYFVWKWKVDSLKIEGFIDNLYHILVVLLLINTWVTCSQQLSCQGLVDLSTSTPQANNKNYWVCNGYIDTAQESDIKITQFNFRLELLVNTMYFLYIWWYNLRQQYNLCSY